MTTPSHLRLQLQATPEEVMRAVEALREFASQRLVQEQVIFGLSLALEECGSNIVNHAYRRDPRQVFEVTLEHTTDTMSVELRDSGPAFDPTQASPRLPDSEDSERLPGGWGIQLVRHYMDEITYRREQGKNVLRLTKRLGSPRAGAQE